MTPALERFRAFLNEAADGHDLKQWATGEDDLSSCPCFTIGPLPGLFVKGHCWRSSYRGCDCQYSGVHVYGERQDGERIAELLTQMNWYGEWPLVMEGTADEYRPASPEWTDD